MNSPTLAQLAALLETKIASQLDTHEGALKASNAELTRLKSLRDVSEAQILDGELREYRSRVRDAELKLQASPPNSSLIGRISDAATKLGIHWNLRALRKELEDEKARLNQDAVRAERSVYIHQHNEMNDAQRSRIPDEELRSKRLKLDVEALKALKKKMSPALEAACNHAWRSSNFHTLLSSIDAALTSKEFGTAEALASQLVFQRKPAKAHYESLEKEALRIFHKANNSNSAFAATAKYEHVARNSINLCSKALPTRIWEVIQAAHAPSDQWQRLAYFLTSSTVLSSDVLWVLYWVMFNFSADVSDSLAQSKPHEDIINGRVVDKLNTALTDVAMPKLRGLGYPERPSFLGVFEIANQKEETLLGADFGFLIHLDIGDLQCKKVVRIQAKKVDEGEVDVGSTSEQLRHLLETPQLGYYLFYHFRKYPHRAQGSTICSANDIANLDPVRMKGGGNSYLPVSVHQVGWEIMYFLTFGLFSPNSGIGVDVQNVGEGMTVIGGGQQYDLPKYLSVFAISDEASVRELRSLIADRYYEVTGELDRGQELNPPHRSTEHGYEHTR